MITNEIRLLLLFQVLLYIIVVMIRLSLTCIIRNIISTILIIVIILIGLIFIASIIIRVTTANIIFMPGEGIIPGFSFSFYIP